MQNVNDKSGFYAVFLFFIWPLLAVASAFHNYQASWGKNILWAFTAFYGFAFAIGVENQGSDIVRYIAEIELLASEPMTVGSALDYFIQKGEIDVMDTFISVIVSRFTANHSLITLVYGIIFGYFFSRNLWYILERLEGKIKPITVLLFVCFFLVIPVWKINGFRMWTAAHVFIYGVLPFLFEGRKDRLLISVSSILFHFSFIVPVGVLFGYLILGNRLVPYFIFFLATFFISEIDINAFNKLIEGYAPDILQERTSSYRSETQVEAFREGSDINRVWYVYWHGRALYWSITGFLIILFFKGRTFFKDNKQWLNLFSFTLLFTGIVNLLSSVPSVGRFFNISYMVALALIILYIQNKKQAETMERFVWAAIPALMLYVIVAFRIGLYSMSATAVLGNPLIAMFFMGENISLNDVMKMIL